MSKKITNKKLDIVVSGLNILDQAIANAEDKIKGLESGMLKIKKKDKTKERSAITIGMLMFLSLSLFVFSLESPTTIIVVFLLGITIIGLSAFIIMKSDSDKAVTSDVEIKNQKKMVEYIINLKNNIDLLLEKKDELYDYYITPSQNEHLLVYVSPEINDKEEAGVFHSIYINEFKIIKEGKYCTLIIEQRSEWAIGFNITMEISYDLFKELATWLR